MGSDLLSFGRRHRARCCPDIGPQELSKISLADEADSGAVLFLGDGQAKQSCDPADFFFREMGQREECFRKGFLGGGVQEVRLILALIESAFEKEFFSSFDIGGVVARGEGGASDGEAFLQQELEFDFAVAQHVGVWR